MDCEEILKWYRRHRRDLPWRKTGDPYRIWVSEIMLQQTQVDAVVHYYEKFLTLFPNIFALANAQQSQVLSAWSGLGYYSRARNLHKGAKQVVQQFAGQFPRTRKEALAISGIGPYTAGAILSIAYNLPEPLVDGNVQRVFARVYGIQTSLQDKRIQKFFWEKALELVSQSSSPRDFNQALMELGATVCTKANPKCNICPVTPICVANRKKLQHKIPVPKRRQRPYDLYWVPLIYSDGVRVLLQKNTDHGWWKNMWDLPRKEFANKKVWQEFLKQHCLLQQQSHTVTHHRIHVAPVLLNSKKPNLEDPTKWVTRRVALKMPISSLTRKILASFEPELE